MDSTAPLDYALFQLTPTRTRCDLVVFSGGMSEKIASGLVEPFVSHLKFAKDLIQKGGYSITLRPRGAAAAADQPSSWFTKSTLQRFVRFVSTPEILERPLRIEREILQIESSVKSNVELSRNPSASNGTAKKSTALEKPKGEVEGTKNNVIQEENSKICLQRLMETRKTLLRKEQAMAYARALVAGFEIDNMDNLISFSHAFGASRLREACAEFKDLYKKKSTDGLWMDELAGISSSDMPYFPTPGILLPCETNGSMDSFLGGLIGAPANSDSKDVNVAASDPIPSTPAKAPAQMPWPNQLPQYMYNFPGSIQLMPPHYPMPIPWIPSMNGSGNGVLRESNHRRNKKSTKNSKHSKTEEDEQSESNDSLSGDGSDEKNTPPEKNHLSSRKKQRKKSTKTVVIRNINYITSTKRSKENDEISNDSTVNNQSDDEQNVISFNEKTEKVNENWGNFQSLLLKDNEPKSNGTGEFAAGDISPETMITNQRDYENGSNHQSSGNDFRRSLKRSDWAGEEEQGLSREFEQESSNNFSDFVTERERSIIKAGKSEDWLVVKKTNEQTTYDFIDYPNTIPREMVVPIDDSFMIQARSTVEDQFDSQWRRETSIVMDLTENSRPEHGSPKRVSDQPDDLFVSLGREATPESGHYRPELDYGIEIPFKENNKNGESMNGNSNASEDGVDHRQKNSVKEAKPKGVRASVEKKKPESLPTGQKQPHPIIRKPVVQKSKLEQEEEIRKKMEELMIQRQKRIAERTAASKKVPAGSKMASSRLNSTNQLKHIKGGTSYVKV